MIFYISTAIILSIILLVLTIIAVKLVIDSEMEEDKNEGNQ